MFFWGPYGANHGWLFLTSLSCDSIFGWLLGRVRFIWSSGRSEDASVRFSPLSFIQSLLSRCERRHQGRFHANMLFGNDVIPMGSSVLSDGRRLRKGERLSLILASSNIIMKCHNPAVRLPKNTCSLHFQFIMLLWKWRTLFNHVFTLQASNVTQQTGIVPLC